MPPPADDFVRDTEMRIIKEQLKAQYAGENEALKERLKRADSLAATAAREKKALEEKLKTGGGGEVAAAAKRETEAAKREKEALETRLRKAETSAEAAKREKEEKLAATEARCKALEHKLELAAKDQKGNFNSNEPSQPLWPDRASKSVYERGVESGGLDG